MFETVSWVKPDKTNTPIMVEVRESGGDIEFITPALVVLDDLIRRGHRVYRVYEVLGYENGAGPFTVRCEPNRREP